MHAQGMTGDAAMAAGGDSSKQVQRKLHYDETEDHTKPLNVPSMVPSEPESTGKAEHINRYLSQVQLHSSDDVTASHVSADHDSYNPEVSAQLHNSYNLLHSLMRSQASVSSAGSGEALHEFQSLRQNLLEQQQRELEELFIQQRREQMMLQNEIEEHQKRMKEQQDFLITNAPENIKVQSQAHDGELSPDSNSGDETNLKRFNFPPPKQAGHSGGGAGILSPSTLMFNTSASSTSPKVRRPVLRSPAYEPGMKEKFDKLTATGRGFLTRCLLNSDKVQGLVKTIKDTREFAFSFQSETPIKKGNFTSQDRNLLERIVAQLQAALLDVHEIFFDTSIPEQMALIEQTRMNSRERSFKLSTDESVRGSGPRISAATLKALERKKKAQEAEASVFGAAAVRPRTAPPATSSPRSHTAVDLSGPLKRHYQSLLAKAMKPAAMQAHHAQLQVSPIRPDNNTARSEKSRPQTAPEKSASSRPKKPVTTSVVTGGGHSTESRSKCILLILSDLVKPTIRLKQQQPQHPPVVTAGKSSKTERKSSKSWR
ncbi:hypothetical protein BaRGS_00007782 [Batillaria attramentaria]|uniref:Uncharacterized protein n=1 Tax=Batillaria attramentaria TaxID=370345 RepID=A0ABD0LNJ3_9CAEN